MEVTPIHSPFTVAIDTREQLPWTFTGLTAGSKDRYADIVVRTEVVTLPAGDYGIVELPGIAIERKSLGDLYSTLTAGRQRFVRELERLSELDFAAVVVETSFQQIAQNPPPMSRAKPRSIVGSIIAFSQRYPVAWVMPGNRRLAEGFCYRTLERFWLDTQEGKRPRRRAERTSPVVSTG